MVPQREIVTIVSLTGSLYSNSAFTKESLKHQISLSSFATEEPYQKQRKSKEFTRPTISSCIPGKTYYSELVCKIPFHPPQTDADLQAQETQEE
ncbi:hypothetical protein ElyMa_006693200 [Elysia marginata]|uniref:Uncharacterized protein n=1 Tax=Elysia marginata TaxID=1093978 RepID=A0AAV4IRG5_9GAST|nr:hypothetical protein ElyMa_006693200 [Elysia marginata]